MYSCSYGMRILVLLFCFKSSIVLCIGPYSCLLFRMCIAYAELDSLGLNNPDVVACVMLHKLGNFILISRCLFFWSEAQFVFVSFCMKWLRLPSSVSGDQADKSVAALLEVAWFDPIKTVIPSPESTVENVLQWMHNNLVFCFAGRHEYLSNDLPLTVTDSFTNFSVVNFYIIQVHFNWQMLFQASLSCTFVSHILITSKSYFTILPSSLVYWRVSLIIK
jgi:hypothetical protein